MASIPFEKALEIALEQHRAGHFARAETLYLEILRQDPGNVDAIHLLGVLAHQGRRSDMAEQLIGRAISRRGDVPTFHYNLAEALRVQGKREAAASSYRRAIELLPDYFEAHNNLAIVLNDVGDFVGAENAARRAVELSPEDAAPLSNLGNALRGLGRVEEAEAAYTEAIRLNPEFAEAEHNLGILLGSLGRLDEAVIHFERAIRLNPTDASTHNNLGATLARQFKPREAAERFETAVKLSPKFVEAMNNFGATLRTLGHIDQSVSHFVKATEADPDFIPAHINLASSYKDLGQHDKALASIDEALKRRPQLVRERFLRSLILRDLMRIDDAVDELRTVLAATPDDIPASTALGYALLERGDMDAALQALNHSVALKPDPQTLSNVLMTMDYHPGYSPVELLRMHRIWSELHEMPFKAQWGNYANDRTVSRRLRVGYVSPDFRGHVVGHFLKPILEHHDHESFEVFGYANLTNVDMHTWEMRSQIDQWREVGGRSLEQVVEQIRADRIDILVELAGHTGGNALAVFARKPAPVQINMIGFPGTTGLAAMDYRITDARCDPPGIADEHNSETLIRMSKLFWVYKPPHIAPPIGPLPVDENGRMTFTSVNNFTKVTPTVQRMWAELLRAVPTATLVLQTMALQSEHTKEAVRRRFADAGIDPARLDFRPWSDFATYLNLLNSSDITLDPYPFNGGTTTCHSLWMGAPVLTLAGDRHASRMGLSMMTNVGLPEFVAHTPEEYVAIGQRMAEDLAHLRQIRRTMRERLLASPLLDAPGYTRELEAVYRDVWAKWCATGN